MSIFEGAALGSVQERGQIVVAGPDRASFLQGFLTNDVQALTAGQGCYAAWLTPQGRMLTDLHVLESDGTMLLDVPSSTLASTVARLEQYHFSEDVTIGSMEGALTGTWVHGPQAASVVHRALTDASGSGSGDLASWPQYTHRSMAFAGDPVVVVRLDQLNVPGYCLYAPPDRTAAIIAALQAAGAARVDRDAIEAARIEACYPLFGVDMQEDTIPLEAGIEGRAISTTKGCYVGQEVIIRVLHRGGGRVAKKLVGLVIDGARPAPGAKVWSGEREVGRVTSAAMSPRSGAVALAYLHRDFLAPGPDLAVDVAEGRAPARLRP